MAKATVGPSPTTTAISNAPMAQLAAQGSLTPWVGSSTLPRSTNFLLLLLVRIQPGLKGIARTGKRCNWFQQRDSFLQALNVTPFVLVASMPRGQRGEVGSSPTRSKMAFITRLASGVSGRCTVQSKIVGYRLCSQINDWGWGFDSLQTLDAAFAIVLW